MTSFKRRFFPARRDACGGLDSLAPTKSSTILSFRSPSIFCLFSFLAPLLPEFGCRFRRTRLPSPLPFSLLPSLPRLSLRRADKKAPAPSQRRNHGNAPASHVLTSQRVKYNRLPRATKTSRRLFRRRLAAELPRGEKKKKERRSVNPLSTGPDTYIIRDYLSARDRRWSVERRQRPSQTNYLVKGPTVSKSLLVSWSPVALCTWKRGRRGLIAINKQQTISGVKEWSQDSDNIWTTRDFVGD